MENKIHSIILPKISSGGGDDEIFIFNINTNKQIAGHNVLKGTLSRVLKRKHFRYKSMQLKELEANTFALLGDNDKLREFVKQTKKIFHRYSRDQYALALDVFSSAKNPKTFQRALDYCIENKTFGMKTLYDAYKRSGGECKEKDQAQKKRIITGRFKQINIQAVKVTARNIGCYEALTKKGKGLLKRNHIEMFLIICRF